MHNLKKFLGRVLILDEVIIEQFAFEIEPNWLLFCRKFMDWGYKVFLYISPRTQSKYITLVKNNRMVKVRYSSHAPNYNTWERSDVQLCVGPSEKGMLPESEVIDAVRVYCRDRSTRRYNNAKGKH